MRVEDHQQKFIVLQKTPKTLSDYLEVRVLLEVVNLGMTVLEIGLRKGVVMADPNQHVETFIREVSVREVMSVDMIIPYKEPNLE